MAYVVPTPDDFFNRFPVFGEKDPVQVQALITEASGKVDNSWLEADYAPAILYLTAHLLVLDASQEDEDPAIGPAGSGQVISSESISGMSVSYFNPSSSPTNRGGMVASELEMTEYGRRFRALLINNRGGPLVV